MGDFVDSFASILDRLECMGAKIDEDLSVVMLLGSINGNFESTVEAIKTLGDEKLTWDNVCSRLIEVAKTHQNKRRDVALTGREVVTCDFCDKRGHDASRCWKNPDNRNNRLDSSSDAGPSTGQKHKKKAPKAARASKAAARATKAYKVRKQSAASSSDSCSSDDYAHARKVRLNTAHAVSSALRAAQDSSRIILDSGASTHMCPHRSWFKGLRSRERTDILLGDDSSIACDSEGTINFSIVFRGKNIRFCLDNVLFTPRLKHTLLSCSALAYAGYQTLFTAAHCTLTDCKAQVGPETIARMRPRNGIYYVPAVAKVNKRHDAHLASSEDNNNGDSSDSTKPAAQLAHSEIVDRWHCRLGHAGRDRVRELMRNGELHTIPDVPICDACVRGKHSRDSFPGSICTATKPGDVIHSDVVGPVPRSHSGCRYTVSFIDEHSRYVTVFAMKQKYDVLGCFKPFVREF
jgi:GAG-pre-integrase domain/gag-polypeptide of LTR copia-type